MRKIGTSFRKPSQQNPDYCLMILSSVYMPQGGSAQRSKGLESKGPVLTEREEHTPSDGPKVPKSPQKWGVERFRHWGRTFRTRAWRIAPCRCYVAPQKISH